MAFYEEMPSHEGEQKMRAAMGVFDRGNPTVPMLSPQLSNHLQIAPLLSIGILDSMGRPWTTLWGGTKGMARPLGGGIIGIRTLVTSRHDPVVEQLVGSTADGQIRREEGKGRMVSGLTLDLETRKRVKLFGHMVAGALGAREDEVTGLDERSAEIQLVLSIEQSLGNCPKYLNSKHIKPALSNPELLSTSTRLHQRALDLVAKADLFFVSSSQHDTDMDTNHRGGPAGFLRVASNDESGAVLCWPEYSGNRLYQTLGNLFIHPMAGLCVPDFETGDVLYATGRTEILLGGDAAELLPRSNLCVRLTVTSAQFVTQALPFRGAPGALSPYNPVVRYLASEKQPVHAKHQEIQHAVLLSQTKLTPSISRFRFSLEDAARYRAGQYVTLDLSDHLDIGYSHMRDDDPRSLNDDFVRTFTVSSPPQSSRNDARQLKNNEFEITMRKVGVATEFLFKHGGTNDRSKLELIVKGFEGEFEVQQDDAETVCFIAAGVGITPLLPALGSLDFQRLRLFWTIRREDLGLVLDTIYQYPNLGRSMSLYITDTDDTLMPEIKKMKDFGAIVQLRRLSQADLGEEASKYFLCTGVPLRKHIMEWLPGKTLIFEDFNF